MPVVHVRCLPSLPVAELGQTPGDQSFWRFNRIQDYGQRGENETAEQLAAQFGDAGAQFV
jgi:hypothetical protein